MDKSERIVAVSGGFDPVHIGHIRYLKAASEMGKVLVMLNTDEWLTRKKGKPFMPYEERKEILEAIRHVHKVVPVIDSGDTVSESILHYKPDIFAKGGDRTMDNIPEEEKEACRIVSAELVVGVGGGKIQSSSWLTKAQMN
jgi:D-beta-D-heptose 7-phosphate kinase/D-beta-D-heptose 1-phosphate adenosyltransferase